MADAATTPARMLALPEEITPDLHDILSRICFEFIHIAWAFRAAGVPIKTRAEDEQAFGLSWLLKLYADHGAGWREAASQEILRLRAAVDQDRGDAP